ncbi:MAG TPA: hypothetical protein VNF75_09560, partial [Candidatus Dormibacteraeota bacterium]|nr:hypothetical protein [Candidatus Dormibacteraeota bacterium]
YYAVEPSTQYTMSAYVIAGATARSCKAQINWYTSADALISSSTGTAANDNTSTWTQYSVTATSPSNAAYAKVEVIVTSAASSELHYVDEVGLFLGGAATWSAGGLLPSAGIIITRSDGVYVRLASAANPFPVPSATQLAIVNDYEAAPATPYTYTAVLEATGSQGPVQSNPTAEAGAALSTTQWWELDPTDPSTAVAAQPIQWNPSSTEQSAAHQVLQQTTMNVVASAMMETDMNAQFEVFTAAIYNGIWALATGQKTVFFSDPFGNAYYFRIAPQPGGMSSGYGNLTHDTQLLPSTSAAPHRTVAVTGVASARPAV